MDERANLLFYWFFKGRNSFKSRLPHKSILFSLTSSFARRINGLIKTQKTTVLLAALKMKGLE